MAHWPRKDNITVQGLLVFAVPSTKVCSNIYHLVPQNFGRRLRRHRNHHTSKDRSLWSRLSNAVQITLLQPLTSPSQSRGEHLPWNRQLWERSGRPMNPMPPCVSPRNYTKRSKWG